MLTSKSSLEQMAKLQVLCILLVLFLIIHSELVQAKSKKKSKPSKLASHKKHHHNHVQKNDMDYPDEDSNQSENDDDDQSPQQEPFAAEEPSQNVQPVKNEPIQKPELADIEDNNEEDGNNGSPSEEFSANYEDGEMGKPAQEFSDDEYPDDDKLAEGEDISPVENDDLDKLMNRAPSFSGKKWANIIANINSNTKGEE